VFVMSSRKAAVKAGALSKSRCNALHLLAPFRQASLSGCAHEVVVALEHNLSKTILTSYPSRIRFGASGP